MVLRKLASACATLGISPADSHPSPRKPRGPGTPILPLGFTSLTPAKRLKSRSLATLGISPADSRSASPRSRPQNGSTWHWLLALH